MVFATLFDFDGVLVDSEPVHLAAFNDVLGPKGMALTQEEYVARYLSLDDAGVFRATLSRRQQTLREEDVRALVEAKHPRFLARFADTFRVFPGALELLARRAARGPVGIVSGSLHEEITFALDRMGMRGSVQLIVSAERTTAHKPDPAPYLLGLEELRRLGHDGGVVALEDSAGGVASAKKAGLRCVAVAHSCGHDELARAGADAVTADLASLSDGIFEGSSITSHDLPKVDQG
ncbi:MAG TPA: HAD family phosphatase [Polyangiaceae bacterium]|jgi:beta-phosphoglucomutase-like phosphatase (HAD superfamily)